MIDRFSGSNDTVTARSFYVQGVQTLTPRLYAATRFAHVDTPPVFAVGRPTDWTTAEVIGGVRLTPEWTVRTGYVGQRPYFGQWNHQAAVSLVWDARWWR